MHRSEQQQWSSCVSCGAAVIPAADRCYRFGERGVLCFECSIERGGNYDEHRDQWRTEPQLGELSRFAD